MIEYYNNVLRSIKVGIYRLLNNPRCNTYPKTVFDDDTDIEIPAEDFKSLRINTLLYIKQCKNTFFKYTCNDKFNQNLYNSFLQDDNFDGGDTGLDDEDNIRIFDKYILNYIKNRNNIMTYFQCKGKKVNIKTRLQDLRDFYTNENEKDILFVIDMADRDIFDFCIDSKKNISNINITKNIILSLVYKINDDYIKIKIESLKTHDHHPYILLESCL
jgi:hypothetical protein